MTVASRRPGLLAFPICALAIAGMAVWISGSVNPQNTALADPTGIKYTGAGRCAAASCHGSPKAKPEGTTRHNENTHWAEKDGHAKAYTVLTNEESQEMGKHLKIDVTKSERCLSCHALSGLSIGASVKRIPLKPADIDKAKYSIEDGVTCDGCHGPAAKYIEPHAKPGWTRKTLDSLGGLKAYDQWGLYFTKDLKLRANTCVSCHLKIEADLLAAGHPRLPFELNLYSTGEWVHWRDKGKWFGGKAWALGQAVSLREAAEQLAERVEKKAKKELVATGYKQMVAYGLQARQVANALDPESLTAIDAKWKEALDQWADAAKATAALKAVALAANGLADKVNAKTFDQATVDKLLKGVAAEGAAAGGLGFEPAEQFTMSLTSLWTVMTTDSEQKDAEANTEKIDALYDPMGEPGAYKQTEFVTAAKGIATLFAGGKALPLPPGGPK